MFRKQKDLGVVKKRTQSINQLINILWTFISTSVTFSVSKSALWVAEWPNVRRRIISISPISQVISHTVRGIEYALHCSTWCWPSLCWKANCVRTQTMRAGSSFYCSGKLQSFNSHLWGKIYVEQTRSIKVVMSLDLEYHYVIIYIICISVSTVCNKTRYIFFVLSNAWTYYFGSSSVNPFSQAAVRWWGRETVQDPKMTTRRSLKYFQEGVEESDWLEADQECSCHGSWSKGRVQKPQLRKNSAKGAGGYPPFPLTFFR